jgi:hypothetical protein
VDEVSGQPWQLVTAVHDEIDGLYFVSNTHKVMTALILVILVLGVLLKWTETVTFKNVVEFFSAIS